MSPQTSTSFSDPDIAKYEVSEDGVYWRPYDPERDADLLLHKRIQFAEPDERRQCTDS